MTKTKKKIESFTVNIKSESNSDIKFEDIIMSDVVKNKECSIKGKHVELLILETSASYIIGLVKTSRRNNIPPKTDRRRKTVEPIGLTEDEGLGFANIFIYEKKRNVLMYEVNKNGCYIDHFIDYIYKCYLNEDDAVKDFSLNILPILSLGSYERIMNMDSYKSIEYHIANPTEVMASYEHKNDAVYSSLASAKGLHSDRAMIKYDVRLRGRTKHAHKSLANIPIGTLLNRLLTIMRGPNGKYVEKVQVVGYEQDSEDNKLCPIDLVTDRYIKYIPLDEPRENHDLLQDQRLKEIKKLYLVCKRDFDNFFKQKK